MYCTGIVVVVYKDDASIRWIMRDIKCA
jgi:hypothetical protein